MPFLRIFQHLLPSSAAWRLTIQKTLRSFFEGLAGAPADARNFVDLVFEDAFPATARDPNGALSEWENQFGLEPNPAEVTRRLALAAVWAAGGGQSKEYLQGVLQTAGFDVYVHEWWVPGSDPYEARDPRLYTTTPLIGTVQCGAEMAQCGNPDAQCNGFLVNEPGYLVNLDLTPRPPPYVPDNPARWRFFMYLGAETFPNRANVPIERKAELERLILKLRPAQQWVVMLVDFYSYLVTEGGDGLITEAGDALVAA